MDTANEKFVEFKKAKQEAIIVCKAFMSESYSYETTLNLAFAYTYERKEEHQLRLVNPQKETSGGFI